MKAPPGVPAALERIDELVAEQRSLRRRAPNGRPPDPQHVDAIAALQVLVDACWDEIRLARSSPPLAGGLVDVARRARPAAGARRSSEPPTDPAPGTRRDPVGRKGP